ncbi:MAG TPA: TrmB family transcriptional regulator [Spirochaeta sp.]|nr:TrmB family transcriptional regulator [Spirochaeta sp.]
MRAGFTEYEAKVYLSLLSNHPASAYSISQHSGVPHSRVYDISRRLIKKGYAVSAGSNPEVFSPLSPEELVEKIRSDNEKLTSKLKIKLESINFSADFDPVWNLHTREEALDKVVEIIAGAEKKIYIGFWSEEYPVLKDALQAAHERGVVVFMLSYGEIPVDFGQVYLHDRQFLDDLNAQGRSIDCAVDSFVCLSGILGSSGNTKVVWSKNEGLINSIEGYIIHDFYIVEIRRAFGDRLYELFGNNLASLRKKFLEDDPVLK